MASILVIIKLAIHLLFNPAMRKEIDTSPKIDSQKLRTVAGAFATGVTVVAVEKDDQSIQGMTANSFLSISLDPPIVAFSVREQASIMRQLAIGKAVGISILNDNQEAISNQFAGRNKTPIAVPMSKKANDAPVVEGALAWYSTIIDQIIPIGDHFLITCKVIDLQRAEEGNPLLYYSGYKTLA